MPPQNREADSFAVFPTSDFARAIHSGHHARFPQSAQSHPETCLEGLLAEIKREYDLLAQKNEILRDCLRQLHGHTEEVVQTSQHKDQTLQEAQGRIQELEQMAHQSKENAIQMQTLESRLKACEQQVSKLEPFLEEITRTARDRGGALLLSEEQNNVLGPAQSVNELDVGTPLKPEDQ